ncbi:MAG TPA: Gfo/Idh/MocA family oxidoreductase [Candidatus Polarisedimenticolaceae bacterium]|nr:Gfo/Idh/MocA family oxidoreductase [Candidatus Polarisedimenticolaceae bacterium]
MRPLRIGLAGLGIHGRRYADHLLAGDVPGAALGAVSRSDRREGSLFALQNAVAFAHDPHELATLPGLDAVAIALPPDLHPPVAIACLEAGRPVLVEKPLAPDAASAERIALAAERTGTPLMVAHTLRFDPLIAAVRDEARRIGRLRMLALSQRFEPAGRSWIDTPGRGGTILNTAVHSFDLLRFLTGAEIVSVTGASRRVVTRDTEDELAAVVTLEPGGLLATVDNARTTGGRSGRIEIVGEQAQVRADFVHRELARIEGRTVLPLGVWPPVPTVAAMLAAFVRCLREDAPMPVTARDGAAAVRACDLAYASIPARIGRD